MDEELLRRTDKSWKELSLTLTLLQDIRRAMSRRIREGLRTPDPEIKALPTFLPPPPPDISGQALVIDIGGSHLRAAVVTLQSGPQAQLASGPLVAALPSRWESASAFFRFQADLGMKLSPPPDLPLGYCFSYPARIMPGRDAILVQWTKDLEVPGVVGEKVGTLLVRAFRERGYGERPITVVNDTVAALLGGSWLHGPGGEFSNFIGLVVGTGTNMASYFPRGGLSPKGVAFPAAGETTAVNLESGNFHPPHLSRFDDELDAGREDKGRQRLEKAVSGRYLPELFSYILKGQISPPFPPMEEISQLSQQELSTVEGRLARIIIERAGDLVAATLAGLMDVLSPAGKVGILVEGSTINKNPVYKSRVKEKLARLLQDNPEFPAVFSLLQLENVNLIGSATAALL